MATVPSLPTNHASGQNILSADINDIAIGANTSEQLARKDAASGYAGLDANSLHKPLQHNDGRGRTWESFGGSPGGSTTVQTNAWTAARLWLIANGGGIITFGVGVYLNMPAMELPVSGCGFEGAGIWATILRVRNTLNADFITNFISPDSIQANAQFCFVRNLQLDGNKANNLTGGRGIFFSTLPLANTKATNDVEFDSHHILENLYIKNFHGAGVQQSGRSSNSMLNVQVYFCDGRGFDLAYDSVIMGCVAGANGLQGFWCNGSSLSITACKSFYSGQITASSGAGYAISSVRNSGCHVSASTSQDNRAQGWNIDTASMMDVAACSADSNCTSFAGTLPAVDLWNATYCHLQVICQDRLWDGVHQTQSAAIRVQTASVYNYLNLTHYDANLGLPLTPVLTWDATSDANTVIINGSEGQQRIAFAASITPNPTLGGSMIVGTLTGIITINAVAAGNRWPGQKISFTITQDATGRAVTWNAIYHLEGAATPAVVASRSYTISFEFDATAGYYRETSRSTSIV